MSNNSNIPTGVSFIIPVYNKAKHLPSVIQQIKLQQGNFPKQYVFLDDGSTDGSLDIVRSKTAGWENVIIKTQPNSGSAAATNAAIKLAKQPYLKFVDAVTSNESKNGAQFIARIAQLQGSGCNIERLLTAAVGINAEGGEFLEIVKKIAFQGKPYDEANINHLKIELGDILWYVAQACIALDVSLDDVIGQNITKLAARYPEGTFSSYFSENRRIDDL